MAEELRIQITAKDGASQVFKAVADSAKKVSDELEAAGRDGEQGLEKIERGAKDADREVDKISDSAKRASLSFRDFDFAITAIGAGLTYAGNAALEQQQTIIGLQKAYGDAADEMINFADEMANITIFNDDDILRGERYFATLRNNYDLTISEVQQLMRTTADLASAYGTSFEDASSRITAAIRGEGEAAEYLGLTMNQQAIDRQNLTLTMTNQEAAQFRLNALYEQTTAYQGTAAALVESEVGTRAKLTNALKDNAQGMAAFVGPLITQAAGMGLATTGLLSMVDAFGKIGPALRNSTIALRAMNLALNPITITVGAVATGAYILWDAFKEGERVTETLAESLRTLNDVQENLILSGDDSRALAVQGLEDYITAVQDAAEARRKMFFEASTDEQYNIAEAFGMTRPEALIYFREQMTLTEEEANTLAAATTKLSNAMADTRVDADALGAEVERLWMRFMSDEAYSLDQFVTDLGNIDITKFRAEMEAAQETTADFLTELGRLREMTGSDALGVDELTASVNRIDAAIQDGTLSVEDLTAYMADLDRQMSTGAISWALYQESVEGVDEALLGSAGTWGEALEIGERFVDTLDRLQEEADAAAESIAEAGAAVGVFAGDMAASVQAAEEASRALGEAFGAETATRMEEIAARTEAITTAMLELTGAADAVSQINLAGLGTNATIAADGLSDAATALEDTFRVIVGNTNAIGAQVDAIQSWADELINVEGEYGKIDDLLADGLITLEQYNAAQAAYNEIASSNADIQNYILEIQTNQAPLIAEQTAALEDQLEVIANMRDAQEQLAALGWMDADMQNRVAQFAEMGNQLQALGPQGQAAMQQVVDGIAATDPVLTAMLEDLGLIEETLDASGNKTYTVNMDALDAMDSTERLIESIDALTVALGGVPPLDLEVSGWSDLELVKRDVEELSALAAKDLLIDIATRLTTPEGEAGGDPLANLRAWAQDNPVTIPASVDAPEGDDPFADIRGAAQNAPIQIPVVFVNAASEAGADAGSAVAGITAGWGAASIEVTADTSAADEAIATTQAAAAELDAASADITITGDESEAMLSISAVAVNLGMLDGATAQVVINAQDNATETILDVGSRMAGLDAASATVNIYGNADDAYADINAISAYNGTVLATSYIDIITRQSTTSGFAMRHGGVPGYDTGGVVIQAAESGPELAYFAGGGVALLPTNGLYSVPEGTYISPNNALNGVNVGGMTVNVNVNGNVYGMDDLTEQVAREMAPALNEAVSVHYREQGVDW